MEEYPHTSKGRSRPFLDVTHPEIRRYLRELHEHEVGVFGEMEEFARQINYPILDSLSGHLISILAWMSRFSSVYEMGSGFGYSASWFARGMNGKGRVTVTDISEVYIEMAKKNLRTLYPSLDVRTVVGDAIDHLRHDSEVHDCIFIDIGDKMLYPEAGRVAIERLSDGGVLIADNVLWRGKVVEPEPDEQTRSIRRFNEELMSRTDMDSILLPVGDGLLISTRKRPLD